MNQVNFHSEPTSTVRELAIAIRNRINAVKRAARTFAPELIILAVMAVATMALKLVHIAVSNPAVASSLTSGRLFF